MTTDTTQHLICISYLFKAYNDYECHLKKQYCACLSQGQISRFKQATHF